MNIITSKANKIARKDNKIMKNLIQQLSPKNFYFLI